LVLVSILSYQLDGDSDEYADLLNPDADNSHAWSYHESPHPIEKAKLSIAEANLAVNPAQALPTSYPNTDPYPTGAEATPLLYRATMEGRSSWKVTTFVWGKVRMWLNPPMVGGLAAVIAGVIPFVHDALFKEGAALSP
jgi:hypothetical protein